MATHDYVIANGTGAAVRSDLNGALAAIVSNNSNTTAPATTYAYQWWADTTTGLLKIRNAANNAWVTIGTLASTNLGLASLASPTFTGTVTIPAGASISGFAPLASPTLTGTPAAPTASAGTNTTQLATTAYVVSQAIAKTGGTMTGDLVVPSLNGGPIAGSRNRIINGDMRIDQRNAGASVTMNAGSLANNTVDRWIAGEDTDGAMSIQRVAEAPAGFTNSLKFTTTTADASLASTQYAVVAQRIEGFNAADFGFGAAGASTITLSFWIRSSLTGSFGGAVRNGTVDRSYPFSYTINLANTWEYKTVTITGDTSGTWATDNSHGMNAVFNLGSGTNFLGTVNTWGAANYHGPTGTGSVIGTLSATWQITGVQLEPGSVATPFERRSYGAELALCQRYFSKSFPVDTAPAQNIGGTGAVYCQSHATNAPASVQVSFPVQMRTTPSTFTTFNTSAANGNWRNLTASSDITVAIQSTSATGAFITSNTQVMAQYAVAAIHYSATSEL